MAPCIVGIWPLPLTDEIIALLQPAADLAGEAIEHGPGWTTWVVTKGKEFVGAAHVRRCTDRSVDCVLVGGNGYLEWIGPLDTGLGAWAKDEGATLITARGRKGWARVLTKLGWSVSYEAGVAEYVKKLGP